MKENLKELAQGAPGIFPIASEHGFKQGTSRIDPGNPGAFSSDLKEDLTSKHKGINPTSSKSTFHKTFYIKI